MMIDDTERKRCALRLDELVQQHRELDQQIELLNQYPAVDELSMRRMKQRKLQLKDQISWLRSRLIPDLDA